MKNFTSSSIDWNSQWASFAKGTPVKGGYEIAFKTLGLKKEGSIFLKAGPGFGDLSHPSTQLMLMLMESFCQGRHCIDIGSGSGILTVSALKLGAQRVEACDIDPAAVFHTKENITFNHFEGKAFASSPEEMWKRVEQHLFDNPLILINMIENEQREALHQFFLRKPPAYTLLTSGLLKGKEEKYCQWIESFGARQSSCIYLDEWSAFVFQTS